MDTSSRIIQQYGQTALVTGATSGIGRAFAQAFAQVGMNLVLVARESHRLDTIKQELESTAAIRVLPIATDLSEPDSAARVANSIAHADWQVDVLVNNAGSGHYGWFEAQPAEQISKMLLLNSYSPTLLTRYFLPGMRERKRGAIILVSGILADFSPPFFAAYAASKAYLQSLAQALYGELRGSGIDVLGVSPGFTLTNFGRANGISRDFPFPKAQPERVVQTAMRALGKQPVVVDGLMNRAMTVVLRFMPRSAISLATRSMLYPGPNPSDTASAAHEYVTKV